MTQAELEAVKLEQIASEYRSRGYNVSVRPGARELPPFLAAFQPDLIATANHDNVVVEVRSSVDLMSDVLVKLAEAVESQHGWRLEVAVVNPVAAAEVPVRGELVADDRVESLLREAQMLNRERHHEAATILAWSAAEAVFRRLVSTRGIAAERKSSGTVLKQMYVLGLIDSDQYDSFSRAMEFRNAFAHGYTASVSPEVIDRLIHDVEELRSRRAA